MSLENLKEYAQRCAAEPELRATAKTIGITDIEGHMSHAETLGLDWNLEDMAVLRQELTGETEDGLVDLSEEELEEIAGGAVTVTAALVVGAVVSVGAAAAAGVGVVAGKGGW